MNTLNFFNEIRVVLQFFQRDQSGTAKSLCATVWNRLAVDSYICEKVSIRTALLFIRSAPRMKLHDFALSNFLVTMQRIKTLILRCLVRVGKIYWRSEKIFSVSICLSSGREVFLSLPRFLLRSSRFQNFVLITRITHHNVASVKFWCS